MDLQSILLRMCRSIAHRGPDSEGIYASEHLGFGMGHTRLSIIDLSEEANQPMCNEDRTIWITYNGEFYNFQEFREELIALGHCFKSRSDTEVIIHLYEEYGIDFVHKMRGMFAFALWDEEKKQLILCRDRLGIKPLYYYSDANTIAFASETKALLQIPDVSKEIDLDALNFYFTFGYIPEDMSIYRSIKKMKPGEMLICGKNGITNFRYWNLESQQTDNGYSEIEILEELEYKLFEAVKLRMISDVPVGLFLSGGLDSSVLACIMARLNQAPIKTYSIGFAEARYNELPHARKIADHIGSDHHEYIVQSNIKSVLPKIAAQFDEPFADSSAIPTYHVSRIAREQVKVVLSGDGGDELFAGYNWYTWVLKSQRYSRIAGRLSSTISNFSKYLPKQTRGKNFMNSISLPVEMKYINRVNFFSHGEREQLFKKNLLDLLDLQQPERTIISFFQMTHSDLVSKMEMVDLNYYLPDDILVKIDRASMLVSLETRVPYLDSLLCEYAMGIPSKYKINGNIKKYILKRTAKNLLPPDFSYERKQGFSMPVREWLRNELRQIFEESVFCPQVGEYLELGYIRKLVSLHQTRKSDESSKLWSILMFALWLELYK